MIGRNMVSPHSCDLALLPVGQGRRGVGGVKAQDASWFPQMLPEQQVRAGVTQHALQPDIIEASKNELQHRSLAGRPPVSQI